MVNQELNSVVDQMKEIVEKAELTFGHLSAAQINWKPDADSWSVGQCFEHLIKSNELFYDDLEQVAAGTRRNSFLEKYSPFSSFFGSLLVSSLKKDKRKIKAPTQKIVPPGEIDANIVELFAAHQSELIGKIRKTENIDWKTTKITSPFMRLVTYKLSDGCRVVIEHEKRHVRQAEKVLKIENFPQN